MSESRWDDFSSYVKAEFDEIDPKMEAFIQADMKQRDFLRLCATGSRDAIESAIEEGADLNRKAYIYGAEVPPIFAAVMEENADAVRLLIERGAHSGDGFTAAVIKGKKRLLKLLADSGGDINQNDTNGNNPLFLAVIANKAKVVRWLIQLGADVNKRSEAGYSALTYTVLAQMRELKGRRKKLDPEIIASLMKAGAEYDEAMIIAVKSGNIPFLDIILANGADVNRKCMFESAQTPLMAAMFTGDKPIDAEMVKFLAEHGADLNEIFTLSPEVSTNALNISITADRPDITEILLSHGANPDYTDHTGRTALVYAVVTNEEIVRILLKHGADPNIPDKNKRTPLMLAALDVGTEPGIMEALIEHGADINAQDEEGMTALLWVVGGKDRGPALMLSSLIRTGGIRAEGWKSWFSLVVIYAAVKREAQLNSIRLLVSHGADVNMPDSKGMNALMCAMMGMDDEAVEILTNSREE
ncbi:MAG: ankyrin repeat domain-containing protein [Synergistaceae bacterium]|nr:ankyrin repeat domain-containing protein [Synergistaceae bacterium]